MGAFAPLDGDSQAALSISAIYEMASSEFNASGGLKDPHGGAPSPLVVVVCNNSEESAPKALDHLIKKVRVPAVLAAMDPAQLLDGFNTYADAFFVSAFNGSKALAQASGGRVWTMLGLPSDYADIYAKMIPRVERMAHTALKTAGKDRDLRVAAVVEDASSFERELADAVLDRIVINYLNVNQQPDKFLKLPIPSEGWSDDDVMLQKLYELQPDIVFSFSGDVFTKSDRGVIGMLNSQYWPGERPVYILSPENAAVGDDVTRELLRLKNGGDLKNNAGRILGIGAAGVPVGKTDALIAFKQNLARYPQASTDFGNYYDAFYFLVNAIYASPREGAAAPDFMRAMKRLTNLAAPEFDIGPSGIMGVYNALDEPNAEIQLYGTMGPPDFDRTIGMRRESGSIYCFDSTRFGIHPDMIQYDRGTDTLTLAKNPTCLQSFLSP